MGSRKFTNTTEHTIRRCNYRQMNKVVKYIFLHRKHSKPNPTSEEAWRRDLQDHVGETTRGGQTVAVSTVREAGRLWEGL